MANLAVAAFPRAHVLIADPDHDTRDLHALTLQPLTLDVEYASDGAEALAAAMVRPPSLVITELLLPRIDGLALCALLRAEPKTRDTEILVVTSAASVRDTERALAAGADAVLVKPATPDAVRGEAQRLLAQSMRLRERSRTARQSIPAQIERSRRLLSRADPLERRVMSRSFARETTSTPPEPPPALHCPDCFAPLMYVHSHVGGVSQRHPEQWDYYTCGNCGQYQYRHRTRKVRKV